MDRINEAITAAIGPILKELQARAEAVAEENPPKAATPSDGPNSGPSPESISG
jgi:hypothetical protein